VSWSDIVSSVAAAEARLHIALTMKVDESKVVLTLAAPPGPAAARHHPWGRGQRQKSGLRKKLNFDHGYFNEFSIAAQTGRLPNSRIPDEMQEGDVKRVNKSSKDQWQSGLYDKVSALFPFWNEDSAPEKVGLGGHVGFSEVTRIAVFGDSFSSSSSSAAATSTESISRRSGYGYQPRRREFIYGHPLQSKCKKKLDWSYVLMNFVMLAMTTTVIVRKVELMRVRMQKA
jgi:hypothetical protein